jgi:hypothetical protein
LLADGASLELEGDGEMAAANALAVVQLQLILDDD